MKRQPLIVSAIVLPTIASLRYLNLLPQTLSFINQAGLIGWGIYIFFEFLRGRNSAREEARLYAQEKQKLEEESKKREKREADLVEHRKKLLSTYLDEFRNPARVYFTHESTLEGFRWKKQLLEHLKTGYAEKGLYDVYEKFEVLKQTTMKDDQKLQNELSQTLELIGKMYNVPPLSVQTTGSPIFYEHGKIIDTIMEKAGMAGWNGFVVSKQDDKYLIRGEDVYGILKDENKPEYYVKDLNDLAKKVEPDIIKLRSDNRQMIELDTKFQREFSTILNEAELQYLKGNCDLCP